MTLLTVRNEIPWFVLISKNDFQSSNTNATLCRTSIWNLNFIKGFFLIFCVKIYMFFLKWSNLDFCKKILIAFRDFFITNILKLAFCLSNFIGAWFGTTIYCAKIQMMNFMIRSFGSFKLSWSWFIFSALKYFRARTQEKKNARKFKCVMDHFYTLR